MTENLPIDETIEEVQQADAAPEQKGEKAADAPEKSRPSVRSIISAVAIVLLVVAGAAVNIARANVYYIADISLEQQSAGMFAGERLELVAQLTSFGAGEPALEWNSSDPSVATVDEKGAVSAVGAGETSVTVTDPKSGRQASCEVSVYAVDQMMLDFAATTLGVGERVSLSAHTGTQTAEKPAYSSSDSAVATVDENGVITAVGAGSASVTVTARGFGDAQCQITVMPAPTVMEADVSGAMCVGETRQLTVSMSDVEFSSLMEYSSADASVVTVDAHGQMKAVAEGETTVTVRAHNGVACDLPVTVGKEPSSVTVSKKATAYNGRPLYLEVSDSTGCCEEYYFTSSDPTVIQVGEDGSLNALRAGSATVTCTSYNGKSTECRVTAKIVDYTTPYVSAVVHANVAALAESYPELISVSSIGTSVQGRDIPLLTLGTGERKVLVVAGMHSKESIAVTFTMRCIEEYAAAATKGQSMGRYNVKKLLSEFTIYFVPLLNPDGMDIYMGVGQPEYTDAPLTEEQLKDFKNNANGVNLNRNFPFEWGYEGVEVTTPDERSYAGTHAGSEPETQAIMALCEAHEFEWMFNMHVKGHMVFYQDKINETTKQSMNIAARLAGRCDFVLNDESTAYEISGGFENWFRKQYGKAGLCVEMVDSKYSIAVNEYFEKKVAWDITFGLFLMCLGQ